MINKRWNKLLALCLTFFMLFSFVSPAIAGAAAGNEETGKTPQEALISLVDYYKQNQPSSPGSSWEAFVGLWGAGENFKESPWQEYKWENLNFPEKTTSNDHIYHIFSLLSIGENPASVGPEKRNLFKELASQQLDTGSFGTPGKHIYAMIALDVGAELGVDVGTWNEENREKAVLSLISQQVSDGSFGPFSKVDFTGWALIVLSNFLGEEVEGNIKKRVDSGIEKAKNYLKGEQEKLDSGDFKGEGQNSNSLASAIQGLVAIGEDIYSSDGPWAINGKTPVDALLQYQKEDGSFRWLQGADHSIGMATKQVAVALSDIVNKESTWYRLSEIQFEDNDGEVPEEPEEIDIKEQLNRNLNYLLEKTPNPTFGIGGGEWTILSLARAGYEVPDGYYEAYYSNVVNEVKRLMPETERVPEGRLDRNKSTEHSRLMIGLASIGKDFRDVGGYDISEALADFSYLPMQGINGPIFALIAFDSNQYEIPVVSGVDQTTKEKIIDYILEKEITDGGWSLGGSAPADPDITAMALQALAPYYENNTGVQEAVDRAIEWLSSVQKEDGGYVPAAPWGSVNSQSAAQVIVALTSLGINPHTDDRFIKNGHSVVDNLMSFADPEGGFKNIKDYGVDGMATEQATYALVAYDRFVNNKNHLFDMTDVEIEIDEKPNVIELPKNVDDPLTIEIPTSNKSKTLIELPADAVLPEINAEKGSIAVHFPKGIEVKEGAPLLELITTQNPKDESIKTKVTSLITNNKEELDEIHEFFTMGGNKRVEFSDHVTFTFKGMADKEAAFIDQSGKIHSIQKFASDQDGLANGKHEYAYKNGSDLIVKTDHFTDFIVFSVKEKSGNDGGSPGNGGGGTPAPSKQTITLSIDKKTINKGYVLKPTKVEFTKGESVWDVLKRELDSRNIAYEHSNSGQYDSVYIESIDGDGEFDHGSDSGWMYNVNGKYPDYGASKYELTNGDRVEWRYTTNLGKDLGEDPPASGGGGAPGDSSPKPNTDLPIDKNEKKPVIDVPNDSKKDYTINISKELKDKEKITVNIPLKDVRVSLDLKEVKDNIPYIEVKKGDHTLVFEKGTKLESGKSTIDTFVNKKGEKQKIIELIEENIKNKKVIFDEAFEMGSSNESITFNKPVTLTFAGKKDKNVGFVDSKGTWHEVTIYESEKAGEDATKDSKEKTYAFVNGKDLIIKTNHFTTFVLYTTEEVKEMKFEDIYKDAKQISLWAYDLIKEATEKDFVDGYAGKINPKTNVTRAEFTKLMVSVLGLDIETGKASSFKDVKERDWFYPYVNTAYKEKIVEGYNDKFLPNEQITREEMATMIVRVLGVEREKSTIVYKDNSQISPWAKEYVNAISTLNLMEGYNNRFNPKDLATREMAIVVAMRAYHYNNEG